MNAKTPMSAETQARVEQVLAALETKFDEYYATKHGLTEERVKLSLDGGGRKFTRIVMENANPKNGKRYDRHVSAFLDPDGNLLKAAGWKTPAKGIRYSVNELDRVVEVADPHGRFLYKQ